MKESGNSRRLSVPVGCNELPVAKEISNDFPVVRHDRCLGRSADTHKRRIKELERSLAVVYLGGFQPAPENELLYCLVAFVQTVGGLRSDYAVQS